MKRRRLLQSIAGLPALPAAAQTAYSQSPAAAATEFPKLAETAPDGVARVRPRLFNKDQMAALERLADLILPKVGDRPGAGEAEAPAFLDFLIGESNAERRRRYQDGLDRLNAESVRLYSKPFGDVSNAEAKAILKPLNGKWTYNPPADPFTRFLKEAKDDLMLATINSRQYATAMSRRSRSAAGMGAYWLPLD